MKVSRLGNRSCRVMPDGDVAFYFSFGSLHNWRQLFSRKFQRKHGVFELIEVAIGHVRHLTRTRLGKPRGLKGSLEGYDAPPRAGAIDGASAVRWKERSPGLTVLRRW
jgi:hypothetical protein